MADKSDKQAALLEELRALPLDASADLLLAVHRGRLLTNDALTRLLGPGVPALLEQYCTGVGDLVYELARLQIKQLELLIKHSQTQSTHFFETWRKAVRKAPAQLQLSGSIGGSAQATVTIENTSSSKAKLTARMDPPAGAGTPIPAKHCVFDIDPAGEPIEGGALFD